MELAGRNDKVDQCEKEVEEVTCLTIATTSNINKKASFSVGSESPTMSEGFRRNIRRNKKRNRTIRNRSRS